MSGDRLVLTLAHELRRRGNGVATLCGGGGQGDALLLNVLCARLSKRSSQSLAAAVIKASW